MGLPHLMPRLTFFGNPCRAALRGLKEKGPWCGNITPHLPQACCTEK